MFGFQNCTRHIPEKGLVKLSETKGCGIKSQRMSSLQHVILNYNKEFKRTVKNVNLTKTLFTKG